MGVEGLSGGCRRENRGTQAGSRNPSSLQRGGSGRIEADLDGLCGGGVPGLGRDDLGAKGFGEAAQVVAEGPEESAEAAEQASFGHELVEGVGDLQQVVEDLDGVVVGAVGVREGVSGVLLGVEAFVLNLPA